MNIIVSFSTILVLSTLIESLTRVIKGLLPEKLAAIIKPPLLAAGIGILLSTIFQIDLFILLGLQSPTPSIAHILTGLILSAGSSALHELLAKLRESRLDQYPEPQNGIYKEKIDED